MIIDTIWINGQAETSSTYTKFITLTHSHTTTVAQRGQTYILTETANLTVFNPVQPLQFTDTSHINFNSIVVRLQAGNTSFLLTGDADAEAEQDMIAAGLNLHCNVLKVGHHGSQYATTQPFLDQVEPSYAIISAGKNNPYGHPAPETVQRLLTKGVTTYATFESGTIVVSTDGTAITIQDSPQTIPEFGSRATLLVLTTAALSTIAIRRRTIRPKSKGR
jgi:competence protein ComEC